MATYSTPPRPIKGILKNKGSTTTSVGASAQQSGKVRRKKSQRWDESNILATRRSLYRDYDLVKANEPGTPFVGVQDIGEVTARDVEAKEVMTPDMLAKKLAVTVAFGTKGSKQDEESGEAHTSQLLLNKQEKQRHFEMKRKLHYSEGLNIKFARQLLSEDLQDEMDEDGKQESLTKANTATEVPAGEDDLKTQFCNA